MLTEELITQVETKIRDKYPTGLKGLVSEIYILTTHGEFIVQPYMDKDEVVAQTNALRIKLLLGLLNHARRVAGVVQVSSGWIVDGKINDDIHINPLLCPHKKEILLFNAKGESGPKIRVYEIRKIKGKRMPAKLAGTFDQLERGGE